jgi:DNA repair protein RAD16
MGETDAEFVPVDPDELIRKAWDRPLPAPRELLLPLLPYQQEGLGWMVHQENGSDRIHGGILADEMGMGAC